MTKLLIPFDPDFDVVEKTDDRASMASPRKVFWLGVVVGILALCTLGFLLLLFMIFSR